MPDELQPDPHPTTGAATPAPADAEPVATAVLDVLERHSNYLDRRPDPAHRELRLQRIRKFVRAQQPVEMVILGFPAKSPNRNKTLSDRADRGEVEGLRTLDRICGEIARLHRPGAVTHVCSDGHVFADLVNVTDANVDRFQGEIEEIVARFGFTKLRTFSARRVYPEHDGDALRRRLVREHAKDLDATRAECLETDEGRALWCGIHRFLFEDDLVLFPDLSRNRVRERAKQRAYEVIRRSQAFSSLVAATFPDAVRLSIHPHVHASAKLGVRLVPSDDRWATPWHNVLVETAGGPRLMHRAVAEQQGGRLCLGDDRFAYYDLRP